MPEIRNRCVKVQEGGVGGEKDGRREIKGEGKKWEERGLLKEGREKR